MPSGVRRQKFQNPVEFSKIIDTSFYLEKNEPD